MSESFVSDEAQSTRKPVAGSDSDQIRDAGCSCSMRCNGSEQLIDYSRRGQKISVRSVCTGRACVINGIYWRETSSKPTSGAEDLETRLQQDRK